MQDQIADGIFIFRASHPNLIRRELRHTRFNTAIQLGQFSAGKLQEFRFVGHFGYLRMYTTGLGNQVRRA